MSIFKKIKRALLFPLIGIIFASSALIPSTPVYAEPVQNPETEVTTTTTTENTTEQSGNTSNTSQTQTTTEATTQEPENTEKTDEKESEEGTTCYSQVGGLGWLICPIMSFLSRAVDTIYGLIEDFLILEPISTEEDSPIFTIWLYARNITNIVFIIFLMVVIYSQITGFGISNYGIKKALPRLIISVILVNLSYLICVLAVDVSNIVGHSLHDFLIGVADSAASSSQLGEGVTVSFYNVFTTIAVGGVIGALAIGLSGGFLALLLAIIPVILGGIVAVAIGLVTVSLRHAVIILLVTISPLAFVAYLLPNTEKWYKKWVGLFSQMLFFYPMFSLLFGVSRVASGILIGSADSMLGIILGLAVQVLPLIFAIKMMKMSGTILGSISRTLGRIEDKASAGVRAYTEPARELARAKQLANGLKKPFNPLSGASWRAAAHKRNANLQHLQKQADSTVSDLTSEQLNALRINKRIIGYDKNNQPIYTQRPAHRSNKYMDAESAARDANLRKQVSDLAVENTYSTLGDYLKDNNIKGRANRNSSQMGGHYLNLRKQLDIKLNNDEADERFYNENIMKAAERDIETGELKHKELYDEYIKGALGSYGYSINQKTAEGRRLAEQAAVNIIGNAYSRSDAQRAQDIKRFEGYMDRQVTKEVLRQYEDMIKYDNIDGIIAAHNVLSMRGDYDKIAEHMTDYMNSGKVKLGEDAANRLAMNFLGMKDAAPALARIGKFINMETWALTDGKRQTKEVTMKQYLTGIVDGDQNEDGSQYTTKINLASAMAGTKLTGIDRTSYGAFDAITRQITSEEYSMEEAIDARWEIEKSMLPQEVSALPTFTSGSEQILSMVAHMTGMKFNQKTRKWEDGISGRKDLDDFQKEVESKVSRKIMDTYLASLTANDLISMKSDAWAGIMARHELDIARENGIDLETTEGQKMAHELAKAELKNKLKDHIDKVATYNLNADKMKSTVFGDLDVAKRQEELHKEQLKRDKEYMDSLNNAA